MRRLVQFLRAPRPLYSSDVGRYLWPLWSPFIREVPPLLGVAAADSLFCCPLAVHAVFPHPPFTPWSLVPVHVFLALGANMSVLDWLAPRCSLPGRLVPVPGAATLMMGCGLPGELYLALSFAGDSPNDREMNPVGDRRSALMPINRKYPLAELLAALKAYPLPPRRRITIEYTLVSGKNDTHQEAVRLSKLLRGIPVKINLIPMNPIEASSLGPPDMKRVLAFQQVLVDAGYSCFIRRRRGDDVSAACGQLALLGRKPKVKGFRPTDSLKAGS